MPVGTSVNIISQPVKIKEVHMPTATINYSVYMTYDTNQLKQRSLLVFASKEKILKALRDNTGFPVDITEDTP